MWKGFQSSYVQSHRRQSHWPGLTVTCKKAISLRRQRELMARAVCSAVDVLHQALGIVIVFGNHLIGRFTIDPIHHGTG